jgi:hypothetical protein
MADDSKKSGGEEDDTLTDIIAMFCVLFFISAVLARLGIMIDNGTGGFFSKLAPDTSSLYSIENVKDYNKDNQEGDLTNSGAFSVDYEKLFDNKISLKSKVINTKEVVVRQSPGGNILGKQDSREIGIVKSGPKNAFGTRWWFIDYEKSPDGWVDAKYLTSSIWGFRLLNIFPIILGALRPLAIILSILVVIVFIFIRTKQKALTKKVKDSLRPRFASEVEEPSKAKNIPESSSNDEIVKEEVKTNKIVEDISIFENNIPENLPIVESIKDPYIEKEENEKAAIENVRWTKIKKLSESFNQSDWRQAIIECDIMLDDLLKAISIPGESIGDRLKAIDKTDFNTLDDAWEAHKARNRIAHDGIDYELSHEESKRIIKSYEKVFREFHII